MTWEALAVSFLAAFLTASGGLFLLYRQFTTQLVTERAARETKIAVMRAELDCEATKRRTLEDRVGTLIEQQATADELRAGLERDHRALAGHMADAVARERDQVARIETLESERAALASQVADLTSSRDKLTETVTTLRAELQATKLEADKVPGLVREVATLRQIVDAAQEERTRMDAMLTEKNGVIARLEGERATLTTDLSLSRDREAALQAEVTALKAQLAALAPPTSTVTVSETTVSEVTVSGTPPADAEKTA